MCVLCVCVCALCVCACVCVQVEKKDKRWSGSFMMGSKSEEETPFSVSHESSSHESSSLVSSPPPLMPSAPRDAFHCVLYTAISEQPLSPTTSP